MLQQTQKRFAFSNDAEHIPASQGHSVNVALGCTNEKPPEIQYDGTAEKFVQSILITGLEKRSRQHVHLSSTIETAINAGSATANQLYLHFYATDVC